MVDLVAKTAFDGALPVTIGDIAMREVDLGPLTSVAPFLDQQDALCAALQTAHGVGFPAPNRSDTVENIRMIWFARDMALLVGVSPAPELGTYAALSDQSDAWAALEISGPQIDDALARLVPVDMRAVHFAIGHTVRTQIGHMNGSITRTGAQTVLILVFRSMAQTLLHDLQEAIIGLHSR